MEDSVKIKRGAQTNVALKKMVGLDYEEALALARRGSFIRRAIWPEGVFVTIAFSKMLDHAGATALDVYPQNFLDHIAKSRCSVFLPASYVKYYPGGETHHGWTGSSEDAWDTNWETV